MNQVLNMIKILSYKDKMSSEEVDAILSELMCCYLSKQSSSLMTFLQMDQFDEFKDAVKIMTSNGNLIKHSLCEIKEKSCK